MRPIRIILIDDHYLLRFGLTTLLQLHKDLSVVGDFENGKLALERISELKPDVAIVDLMMPIMDGVETTRQIKIATPQTHVLVLTTFGTSEDVALAIEAGAEGALLKDATNKELISAIHKVAHGESVFSPEIGQALNERKTHPPFTTRQLEILESVTRGLTNHDIALQFGISAAAVCQHLDVIREKLGAANRAEAVAIALKKHLLKI